MAGTLLQSHAAATSTIDELLAIITSLLRLLAKLNANPTRGGLKVGRRKNKYRQQMEGHLMLVADYFVDDPTHGPQGF